MGGANSKNMDMNKLAEFMGRSWRITIQYLKAKLLISCAMTVVAAVILALLKVPLYGLLGIVAGFCNLFPIVGPWLGALICCLIVVFYQPVYILYVLAVIVGLQILDQFLLTPLIMGRSLHMKPLVVALVVLLAGACFGFWGLLLGVPVAACIQLAYEIFYLKRDGGQP